VGYIRHDQRPKTKDQRPFSYINPKLEVRDAGKYGKGVFAKENVKRDSTLAVFGGHVFDISEEEKLTGNLNDYSLQISEYLVIGPVHEKEVSDSDFFNHSCDPNAGFKGQIFLVAMHNIKKGEQVTFDYAMALSKARNASFYKIKCFCGANNCRGYVTENDWKKPELQKKYDGYFQWYLQDKIKGYENNKRVLVNDGGGF
jgi:hypothetical protein